MELREVDLRNFYELFKNIYLKIRNFIVSYF